MPATLERDLKELSAWSDAVSRLSVDAPPVLETEEGSAFAYALVANAVPALSRAVNDWREFCVSAVERGIDTVTDQERRSWLTKATQLARLASLCSWIVESIHRPLAPERVPSAGLHQHLKSAHRLNESLLRWRTAEDLEEIVAEWYPLDESEFARNANTFAPPDPMYNEDWSRLAEPKE